MSFVQIVFLFFLTIPFLEIYFLLKIGSIIGVFPTVLMVVFTAVLGAWLLRRQGLSTLQRFQNSLAQGQVPALEMIEGAILLVGGALLLTPGFFTDAIGFACLIPFTRNKMATFIIEKHLIQAGSPFGQKQERSSKVIEGEYKKEDN